MSVRPEPNTHTHTPEHPQAFDPCIETDSLWVVRCDADGQTVHWTKMTMERTRLTRHDCDSSTNKHPGKQEQDDIDDVHIGTARFEVTSKQPSSSLKPMSDQDRKPSVSSILDA